MGLLAVLRSKAKGATIGMMITASHNPEHDNGVKLVDPHGEMLVQSWEGLATTLANVSDNELAKTLSEIIVSEGIDMTKPASVFVGRDTRSSSPSLARAGIDGITALSGLVKDFGVVTTPMLHYFVTCQNTQGAYGLATEEGYYNKLISAFKKLRAEKTENKKYIPKVIFDGANGVGAVKMKEFKARLGDSLIVEIFNDGNGILNHLCGADFVKVQQKPPQNVPLVPNARYVSVDGDADRIIYYYIDDQQQFHMLDGDRIATLVAGYLMELVKESGLSLNLGLVQTAYANGSSTNYISKTLKVPVACVPTGVKHLHHKALEFDIGVYFEANGHGTVVFKQAALELIKSTPADLGRRDNERAAAERLATLVDVINQTVGDAISDMLLVETVLHARGWSMEDWKATYSDLPNRLLKVLVKDREVVQTTDAERKCVSPTGLQNAIDCLVSKYSEGRAFVRPSGTEDVVRVYAEASTQAEADKLAVEVGRAVHSMAGGVGDPPSL
ncbi:phosphoacetylglucosamine mutase isoform X2 [Anabrus simplex]